MPPSTSMRYAMPRSRRNSTSSGKSGIAASRVDLAGDRVEVATGLEGELLVVRDENVIGRAGGLEEEVVRARHTRKRFELRSRHRRVRCFVRLVIDLDRDEVAHDRVLLTGDALVLPVTILYVGDTMV